VTFKWLATLAVWGVIGVGALLVWYGSDLPDVDAAINSTRRPSITVLAADNSVLLESGDLYGLPVTMDDIPPALVQAVIATEDRRFYDHFGLDIVGLMRATAANIMAGRVVQGGSTLTQQVAKNLFLTPERNLKRKVQELLLALWLEENFTKDQILTLYLNRVYLGAGTYGVAAAAVKYFGKPVKDLNIYQSAMIAGLLKAPSRYNPKSSRKRAAKRTAQVIRNMVNAGFLTEADARDAISNKGRVSVHPGQSRTGRYFSDWVLERLKSYVTPGGRDLVVKTTLDIGAERKSEKKLEKILAGAGQKANVSQGAVVVMAPDGAVKVMIGGRNYGKSQFNRAVLSKRQPGSAFKAVIYLAALQAGFDPDDKIVDEAVTVNGWSPKNFSRRYQGTVTIKTALAKSINTVAVKLSEKVGRGKVIGLARRLGMTSPMKASPSLALGVNETSLLELTAVYGVFANGGYGVWPYAILEILDGEGRVLYRRSGSGPGRVVAAENIQKLDDMLTEVVLSGTGKKARLKNRAAGKTGTSQNFRDAWFIGYSGNRIAGVWLGNDDGRPMKRVGGGGLPALLWRDVMTASMGQVSKPEPPTPSRPQMDQKPANGFWGSVKDLFEGSDR